MQAKAISFFIVLYFIVIAIAAPTLSGNSNQAGEQSGKGDGDISSLTSIPGAGGGGILGSASDVTDITDKISYFVYENLLGGGRSRGHRGRGARSTRRTRGTILDNFVPIDVLRNGDRS